MASSACSSPSLPSCVSRRCGAHLAVLKASRPLGLCLLCRALTEPVQIGVTAPGQRLALLLWGRGVIRCLEGGQMLRGYLKLCSLRAGCRRCFTFQTRLCSLIRDLSGGGACWQGWGPAGNPRLLLGPCSLHFQAPPVLLEHCCSSCSQEHVPSFALLVPRCSICTFDLYTYFRGAGIN